MRLTSKLAIGAVALSGAATLGVGMIQAASPNTLKSNPMSNLVNAISQKFNLSTTDVQKVFDEQRTLQEQQMQAERLAQEKTRLDQAVKDGKLTQAQEDLVLAKHTESQTFMQGLKDKTQTERQTAIESRAAELKTWATSNNIPEQYVMFAQGNGGRGMGGEGMGRGMGKGMGSKTALDQAVKDGKLTQAQEDLIVAKQTEVQKSLEALKDKSEADRQAAVQTLTDGLKSWAKTNNIPEQYVAPFGHGRMEGRGMGFGKGGERQGTQSAVAGSVQK